MLNMGLSVLHKFFDEQSDELVCILRAHLLVEACLDKILETKLTSPKSLFDANPTFRMKLAIVESMWILKEKTSSSLNNLNKLRNKFSHKAGYKLKKSDVSALLQSFPKEYAAFSKTSPWRAKVVYPDWTERIQNILLKTVIYFLLGRLDGVMDRLK